MPRYKKPSKINAVSIFFVLALAAAVYAGVQFGPAYWRKSKVSEVLQDMANRYTRSGSVVANNEDERISQLRKRTIDRLREVGVEDSGIVVNFEKRPTYVRVIAEYKEVIRHPLIKKITILRFRPHATVKFRQ